MTCDDVLTQIEMRLDAIEAGIRQLPSVTGFATLKADVARIDGKLSNIPTMWQLLTMVVSTGLPGLRSSSPSFVSAGNDNV
jgi:cell fate (sporulation/competence/biofilm development) regulator YmcA (YheA/YmcA/DUF963 family)